MPFVGRKAFAEEGSERTILSPFYGTGLEDKRCDICGRRQGIASVEEQCSLMLVRYAAMFGADVRG